MILPFIFDPEVIDTREEEDAKLEREYMLQKLLEFGIPYFQNEKGRKKFFNQMQNLPALERKKWSEMINGINGLSCGLRQFYINSESHAPDDLMLKLGRNDPALVVLPTSKASDQLIKFGLKPPRAFVPKTKTEYVGASNIHKSTSIRNREEWSSSDLQPTSGNGLIKTSNKLLKPLFKFCRRVVVVDRYAFSSFRSDATNSGFSWFLNLLNSSIEKDCKISIFSTHSPDKKPPIDTDIWVDQIQKQLENINGELNVHLGPDYLYREKAHDRYLRVDDRRLIKIGKGVDAFSGWRINQLTSFSYSALRRSEEIDFRRKFEDDLRRPDSIHTFVRVLGEGF